MKKSIFAAAEMSIVRLNMAYDARQAPVISIPADDAFSVIVQLDHFEKHRLWRGNRLIHAGGHAKGDLAITNLMDEWHCQHLSAFDNLRFHIPRKTIDEFTYDGGQPRIDGFDCAQGSRDPVVFHLAQAVLPVLDIPCPANRIFLDAVTLALYTHVATTYGKMARVAVRRHGRLAQWQERRAKEFMATNLARGLTLDDIARECGLSRAHFSRYFKNSTGIAVHAWLQWRRIEKAEELLLTGGKSLPQIALECGFADQSHFTRVFKRIVGITPGMWQRLRPSPLRKKWVG